MAVEPDRCRIISLMDKPKNREIIQNHYQHKEEKLRQQLRKKAETERELAREAVKLESDKRESFVFRLADESLPEPVCDASAKTDGIELPSTYTRFDYPVNESELIEFKRQLNEKVLDVIRREKLLFPPNNANDDGKEIGISCGQKIGKRVILRGFQDRICNEPRGEINYYHVKADEEATCRTHKQWLDAIANDPEVLVRRR